jgi:hypothetical protein
MWTNPATWQKASLSNDSDGFCRTRGLVDTNFAREVRWPHKPRNLAKSVTVE